MRFRHLGLVWQASPFAFGSFYATVNAFRHLGLFWQASPLAFGSCYAKVNVSRHLGIFWQASPCIWAILGKQARFSSFGPLLAGLHLHCCHFMQKCMFFVIWASSGRPPPAFGSFYAKMIVFRHLGRVGTVIEVSLGRPTGRKFPRPSLPNVSSC